MKRTPKQPAPAILSSASDDDVAKLHDGLHKIKRLAEKVGFTLDIEEPLKLVAAELNKRVNRAIL